MNMRFLMTGLAVPLLALSTHSMAATTEVGIVSVTSESYTESANTAQPAIRPSHQGQRYIRVRAGDTLSKIARRHNVPLKRLQQLNNLYGDQANHIYVGQRIRLR